MTEEFTLSGQRIRFDREETREMYRLLDAGGADRCKCGYCAYFSEHRNTAYSKDFVALLSNLGIDYTKEDEVWTISQGDDGEPIQFYGWFYMAGELEELASTNANLSHSNFPSFELASESPPRLRLNFACEILPPMPLGFLSGYPRK